MSKLTEFLDRPRILNQMMIFTVSTTFVAQKDLWAMIGVIGGGGSGARVHGGNRDYELAAGGNAGGCCFKTVYLLAGTSYNITVGAGGQSPTSVSNGNAGGQSKFVGGGINMTANGGAGGLGSQNNDPSTIIAPNPPAGATASGGDYNYTGGVGGKYYYDPASINDFGVCMATGGGAVNVNGLPAERVRGGNATSVNRTQIRIATGGGGVGGHGGDCYISTGSFHNVTGGGGAMGDAEYANNVSLYTRIGLLGGAGMGGATASKFYCPTGRGGDGYGRYSTNPRRAEAGGGGGGFMFEVPSELWCEAGIFGGGGGCSPYSNDGEFEGGDGVVGGGGGGLGTTYAGTNYRAGHGGAGLVFIDYVDA